MTEVVFEDTAVVCVDDTIEEFFDALDDSIDSIMRELDNAVSDR